MKEERLDRPSGAPTAQWSVTALLAAFAAYRVHALFEVHAPFIHDDAFITLHYARNLLEGHGLVWYPGEDAEGYTSLVAVLGVAALGSLGLSLPLSALVLNFVGYLGAGAALGAFSFRRRPAGPTGPLVAACTVLLVLGSRDLVAWVLGRLEGPLFVGAASCAAVLTLRALETPRRPTLLWAGVALGALPLIRPDGLVLVVVALLFVGRQVTQGSREARIDLALFLAPALLPALVQVVVRALTRGALLPTSVIAKTTGVALGDQLALGLEYVGTGLLHPPLLLVLGMAILPFSWKQEKSRARVAYLLASALSYATLVAFAGGDHMPARRLLLPLLPFGALLFFYGLRVVAEYAHEAGPSVDGILSIALLALTLVLLTIQRAPRATRPDDAAYVGAIVGRVLERRFPPGTVIATNTAGSTPYYAPSLRFIDMLGLNDRHIAERSVGRPRIYWQTIPGHAKGDGEYVLERDPEVILLGPAEGTKIDDPWFLGDHELAASRTFQRRYRPRVLRIDVSHMPYHELYRATRSGTLEITLFERRPPH